MRRRVVGVCNFYATRQEILAIRRQREYPRCLKEVIMNLESQDKSIDPTTGKLVVFEDKQIRRVLHNGEWWFVVKDVVEILTDTSNSTDYIKKMRERDSTLSEGWGQIVTPLPIDTPGGKQSRLWHFSLA